MSITELQKIHQKIVRDPMNSIVPFLGTLPVYTVSEKAKIVIVGQAPGRKAQLSGIPWNDSSGIKLRTWLGVTDELFYDPNLFSLLPMDFYYPGKGSHGDLPPRREFAPRWHPRIIAQMPHIELFILVGMYAQRYYLGDRVKNTLTNTVRAYSEYLPLYFPTVHPSPLNFNWQTKNPWFVEGLVPELQGIVHDIIG
jgi:uracil-DNA glycosylase